MYRINETIIRKLARSKKYQSLYSRIKDLHMFRLFNNDRDLSYVQSLFLDWIEIYNIMYTDLATGEKNINKDVIEDDLRAEAYLIWKAKQMKKNKKNQGKDESKRVKVTPSDVPTIVFNEKE